MICCCQFQKFELCISVFFSSDIFNVYRLKIFNCLLQPICFWEVILGTDSFLKRFLSRFYSATERSRLWYSSAPLWANMVTLLARLNCILLAILWKIGNEFKKHISSCHNAIKSNLSWYIHIWISCKWGKKNYLRALIVLSTSFLKVIFINGLLSALTYDGSLKDDSFDEIPAGVTSQTVDGWIPPCIEHW